MVCAEEEQEKKTITTPSPSMEAVTGEMARHLTRECATLIVGRYKESIDRDDLYEEALMDLVENHPELLEEVFLSMYSNLDKYSEYYTDDEFKYFVESMSGEFAGIGVIITTVPEGLLISGITSESSAAEAGIRQGDIIVAANGVELAGMAQEVARTYVIGEVGTYVNIDVLRNGQRLSFVVERKIVVLEAARYQILEDNIGYLAIDSFDGSIPTIVDKALDEFDSKGITNIIIDLRYNGGGSVDVFHEISQRLIPQGPIIHFEYKNPQRNTTLYSGCTDPKYSIIVLVNEYTASASEAFAAAVQDSRTGIVLGTTTYGKGTMQTLTNFVYGGGIKMTEAEYLSRNKRHIDGVGVKPEYYSEDNIIRLNKSGFQDLDFETKLKLGDKSNLVLALNQRLWAMGYDVGIPTDEYTEKTKSAIIQFQGLNNLYPYGVCDITTQLAIENIMQTHEFMDNLPLKEAIEVFKTNTISEYIPEDGFYVPVTEPATEENDVK